MAAPKTPTTLVELTARPLDAPMNAPFAIATATRARVENVLVAARLADGTPGWGECAPLDAFSPETQVSALRAARAAARAVVGEDAARFERLSRRLEEPAGGHPSVRAGVEMAVLDAWARRRRLPLWAHFGGASAQVHTDVTVTLVPPAEAARQARRIRRRGIRTIKVKVGEDPDADVARVEAVARVAPRSRLIIDANQGYDARTALGVLAALRRLGIRPALFEQPVAREDWEGMARVLRGGGVAVAADESVSSAADARRMARARTASVVNVKLMKYGVREAWEVARIARAAGLGLMMGGMVESRLAMACAAHFAAGFGGFDFVDLDTPLWFARDPMRGGVRIGPGGLYDLRPVKAGIGVLPKISAHGGEVWASGAAP